MNGPKSRVESPMVESAVSPLTQALRDYLRLRQGLGHQLADAARLLPSFVAFLEGLFELRCNWPDGWTSVSAGKVR